MDEHTAVSESSALPGTAAWPAAGAGTGWPGLVVEDAQKEGLSGLRRGPHIKGIRLDLETKGATLMVAEWTGSPGQQLDPKEPTDHHPRLKRIRAGRDVQKDSRQD